MNWFTRESISGRTDEQKKELIEQDGVCPHAEKDLNLAQVLRSEKDTWGPVATFVCCLECDQKASEDEQKEKVICHDCNGTFEKKDTVQWKWYDFYAPQGDQPITVCRACRAKEKHQERVQRDREDCEAEMGYRDNNDRGVY